MEVKPHSWAMGLAGILLGAIITAGVSTWVTEGVTTHNRAISLDSRVEDLEADVSAGQTVAAATNISAATAAAVASDLQARVRALEEIVRDNREMNEQLAIKVDDLLRSMGRLEGYLSQEREDG